MPRAPVQPLGGIFWGRTIMRNFRILTNVAVAGATLALAGCGMVQGPPPPPPPPPAAFVPLGLGATYLNGPVIGGYKARAAKMRAAGIKPLGAGASAFTTDLDGELRRQTAGIGLDVIRLS